MIEPDFLSVSELATKWKATPRQILEHGAHLKLPFLFSFSGFAFEQQDHWLMSHGAADEQREFEQKRALIEKWVSEIKRNAAGLTDKYSRMDRQQVIELRGKITEYAERTERLKDLLQLREKDRRSCEYFGYMRLPPRAIQEVIEHGEIPFPHFAFHPGSRLKLAEADGRQYVDGVIMTLEPGTEGKWKERLNIDDLLIPFPAIKQLESNVSTTANPEPAKRIPKTVQQEKAVLEALRLLGYEPLATPKNKKGASGVRNEVWHAVKARTDLFVSQGVFTKTWERLRNNDEIVDQEE